MTLFDLDHPPQRDAKVLADQADRDAIREALDETLVVEAAAGTGKTTELVRRMVAILEAGRGALDRMVAVTFTEAAAGELKLRLRGAIEEARLDPARPPEAREHLQAALPKLEEARIGTIHSFCADLLREHPVEAGVDPGYEVAADDVARPLFERAFARWFEGQLAEPGPGVRRVLRRWKREPMPFRRRDEGPRGLLRTAAWQLVEHRDFPTAWRHEPGFERDRRIDALIEEMASVGAWAAKGDADDWFTKSLGEIERFVDEVRRAERVRPRDHDSLEAKLTEIVRPKHRFWTWKGSRAPQGFPKRELLAQREGLHANLKRFSDDAGADLAPRLRDELWPVVEAYESAKTRAGCLDFGDLLLLARDLLRRDEHVRERLQRRFTHYFVDEFQDTDPLQAEILLLLAAADPAASDGRSARVVPGKLFVVGDPKQSIYRFRRADVALYEDVKRRLVEQGARLVHLTVSFRAVPEIQEAVNAAFAPRLGGAAGYVPLAPFRESVPTQPAVVALPVPAPYGDYRKVVDWQIEKSLPDVAAAWIDWLLRESGWTVTERERPGVRVPVEARHVCLLFRRFRSFGEDLTQPYVAALEARGLTHLLVGGSSFHEREEIEALRNALAAIERPDDELAVFATLRGPLLALSDAALLAWRESIATTGRTPRIHPFDRTPAGASPALAEVGDALALLRDLHAKRNRRPVAVTVADLLERTRAHAAFAIWPTGRQALANVNRLMDLARRAERQGLVSFRAFVDKLEDEAERGDVAEAPLFEEGVDGVRIMTAHRAKGLEFPVVILADMTAKETLEHPQRWTDPSRALCAQRLAGCAPAELLEHGNEEMEREREEAVRLLYVAATRARDVLVVPVIGDERREGWLAALDPAIHPPPERSRAPVNPESPGCPTFGDDSVPLRPDNVTPPFASVMPGQHAPESGPHKVVWWDPSVLTLGTRASIGLAQTRILEADEDGRANEALESWQNWRTKRDELREKGSHPSRIVRAATEWSREGDPAPTIEIMETKWKGQRPKGPRFGTLVHAVLAIVNLDGTKEDVTAHAKVQARLLGASTSERTAAIEAVQSALEHPLLRRAAVAARAAQARRESPLLVRLPDGTLVESIADLAFREDSGWTVVDFKTDAELSGPRLEAYRRQTALYVAGIAEATGEPARGVLLKV